MKFTILSKKVKKNKDFNADDIAQKINISEELR